MGANEEGTSRAFNVRVKETNLKLAALAGPAVRWLDLHNRFCVADALRPQLTNDGAHLLGPAYLAWRDALSAFLPP